MLERRLIRVLAPFSRTLFFDDRGRQRGITAEPARDFETTTYVCNIYKYYVAYRLIADARAAVEKARQQVAPAKN